ncbi:MAG: hypothetical protein LUD77_02655, partial [Clostridiales bacterium]|nr:hypothetical protein [Clostridiales bacterium]
SAGETHSMAITDYGILYAWGRNSRGQLGSRTTKDIKTPRKIMNDVKAISAGDSYSMAITEENSLYTWGGNARGQFGNGTNEDSYIPQNSIGLP